MFCCKFKMLCKDQCLICNYNKYLICKCMIWHLPGPINQPKIYCKISLLHTEYLKQLNRNVLNRTNILIRSVLYLHMHYFWYVNAEFGTCLVWNFNILGKNLLLHVVIRERITDVFTCL